MYKGIEWLKEAIGELDIVDTVFDAGGVSYIDTAVSVMQVYDLIDQLDEPEVLSQENINLVLDDLNEYIKEQQSLSQNVGLAHTSAGNDTHHRQYDYALECIDEYEPSDDLKNLIVSKQELPVIPKYVADWIKEEQGTMSNWKLPSRFISDSKYKKDQRRYKWSQVEGNMDKFMSALINSYEVEEEPLYYAMVKGHELVHDDIYWNYHKSNHDVFVSRLHPPLDNFTTEMTEQEWFEIGINESNAEFVRSDDQP